MLCEKCKVREATIIFTELVDGETREHRYCGPCAAESEWGQLLESEFPFGKILSGILAMQADQNGGKTESFDQVVCPTCNTSYQQFVENSQFGCPDCYHTFGLLMGNNIKRIQGSDTHTGKRPRFHRTDGDVPVKMQAGSEVSGKEQDKKEILRMKLKEALEEEAYDLAAKYRDEIKALSEGNEK